MPSLRSLLLLTLSTLTSAHPGGRLHQGNPAVGKAVYFLTNEDTNGVVAVPIGSDGSLSDGVVIPTGGKGETGINGMTKQPAMPDGLFSQSALTIAGNAIFVVNPGSNTLTMLTIDPSNPTKLTVVGTPVTIPGDFPNTVAASKKHNLVCVGTTGAKSGVSCASFSDNGVKEMDALRPFDLGQTTPPTGPTNSVSHLFFSEDESTLFCTVKGDPPSNKTGFLAAFKVGGGCKVSSLSTTDVQTSPNGTAVLFGSAPIPGTSNIFATDAAFGAAILAVDGNLDSTLVAKQAIDGQAATCWVTLSKRTKTAFVTDVLKPRLVEMSLDDAHIVSDLDLSQTGISGMIDLRSAGNFVYALAPGNGTSEAQVIVVDVSGGSGQGKLKQSFGLGKLGAGPRAQGMAILA